VDELHASSICAVKPTVTAVMTNGFDERRLRGGKLASIPHGASCAGNLNLLIDTYDLDPALSPEVRG
jgi:hypothetical protein